MNHTNKVGITSKALFYRNDGTGRDTYIKKFNGGLLSQNRLHDYKINHEKPKHGYENFTIGKVVYGQSLPPKIENNVTHYISDGSGRDSYVKINEGGRATNWQWREEVNHKFCAALRSYSPIV